MIIILIFIINLKLFNIVNSLQTCYNILIIKRKELMFMSETQIQAIKDVIKMTPRLNVECLNSVKILMEKAIDSELLRLEPTVILENMDITEKVMYLDYLTESKDTKEKELKNAVYFEEILQREGLTYDDLQNKD